MKFSLSVVAYSKIVLHACRYPHRGVNGVLLGHVDDGDVLRLVDAVPLFHFALGLVPMLEVALCQIEIYTRKMSLQIVGYYQANEHLEDSSPDTIAYRIADKIRENVMSCRSPVLLMVHNWNFGLTTGDVPLKAYCLGHEGKSWKKQEWEDGILEGGASTLQFVSGLVTSKEHEKLVDFDTHLNDITQDWLNSDITKTVEATSSCRQ
ncbi:ER membrane protein complex subunit 8-like [Corticium candelabrum]|uniref:ER membrane protein complex subunit 8-like n=1 Tax=Corticium candelabrum TaxID=121492 RepID=UPI002E25CF4B|nr:ER membrane protein complex subunit 8-like [Corticium candelabrum]